jgi:hypothetical protein
MARVAGHVVHERLTRPVAHAASDVPTGPAAFTTQWLTAVLCRDTPGARVMGFNVTDTSHGSTWRGRIELTYDVAGQAAGLPSSLWFKTSPTFTTRMVTGLTGAARNEGLFYTRVREGLDLLAPYGYHAGADAASCRSIVLLEDLTRTRGASFGGPEERYVTRVMAQSMARELAGYHGALWGSPRFGKDLRWVPSSLRWQQTVNAAIPFEKRTLIGIDHAADVSAPGFIEHRQDVWPAFMRSLNLNILGSQTLLHQDLHAGNWYTAAGGEMGLYDWHCVARGGWALDVAYAFMSGLTVEDRRAWERELLEYYLERLCAAGVDPPGFDDAWLQYRQQTFHGLAFWLITIGAGRLQPDMQPVEISRANLSRMTAAVVDLNSFGALNGTPSA